MKLINTTRRVGVPELILLTTFVLTACPNWEAERIQQCRDLNSNVGVCADVLPLDGGSTGGGLTGGGATGGGTAGGGATGGGATGGGSATGGGMSLDISDAGLTSTFNQTVDFSKGDHPDRTPVYLRQIGSRLVLYEDSDAGASLWISGAATAAGQSPNPVRGCGGGHVTTLIGCNERPTPTISIDPIDAPIISAANRTRAAASSTGVLTDYSFGGVQGIVLVGSNATSLERLDFDGGTPSLQTQPLTGAYPSFAPTEAVTLPSGDIVIVGKAASTPVAIRLAAGSTAANQVSINASSATSNVQLDTDGTEVGMAWLNGDTLIIEMPLGMGSTEHALNVPGAQLLDVAVNSPRIVVLLRVANRSVLVVSERTMGGQTRAWTIEAVAITGLDVKLIAFGIGGNSLWLASKCTGGNACMTPGATMLLELSSPPGGGSW